MKVLLVGVELVHVVVEVVLDPLVVAPLVWLLSAAQPWRVQW